jgi:pyruvate/2-oxoglutarate dehydrogenase complex dihydrolipoamide dehydrogenase (E3) component
MPNIERYENLVIGSGGAGKFIAWTMTGAGRRTALVERKALGGACPNVACLPSKNIIYSAKVAALARRGTEFGLKTEALGVDMKAVQRRKQLMVEGLHQMHVDRTKASGAELIMGNARFIGPRTAEIDLYSGGKRTIYGDRVFLDLGTRAAMPAVPGLAETHSMTHVELLDLDRLPRHLIVLGGGYVGLELAQAMKRFGSGVTVIEAGPQLAGREDPDIGAALLDLFQDEGIEVLLGYEVREVEGRSGEAVRVHAHGARGQRTLEGSDLLVATGRRANTDGLDLELTGVQLSSC